MPGLSELEGCVLGLLKEKGPMTPYAVRRVFLDSPSPHWSGSAGAIYPLVRRLEKRGLIRSARHATGGRTGRRYRITAAGSRALRQWLGTPVPPWVAAVPEDPLRTRLGFLGALEAGARIEFMLEARRLMDSHIEEIAEDCRRAESEGGRSLRYLVARGALRTMRARRRWVEEVLRALRGGA